jgi:hypothetical protein
MREQAESAVDRLLAELAVPPAAVSLFDESFHEGVVGIVAGRLKDRLHRPTFVFARAQDGSLKGSGRSIPGFHLRDALDRVSKRSPGVLRRFGGHAMAAGATVEPEGLEAFGAALRQVAQEWLDPATLPHPTYWIRPPQRLATTHGHHRFVWDLRHEAAAGAAGPLVVPGPYQVRLSAGEWSQSRPLEVRIDPRVAAAGVGELLRLRRIELPPDPRGVRGTGAGGLSHADDPERARAPRGGDGVGARGALSRAGGGRGGGVLPRRH